MEKILYIFITHKKNIENTHKRVTVMMQNVDNSNYVIVQGGSDINYYDIDLKILYINSNDTYEGLPEKVLKSYKYIVENEIFDEYTHFIKLDDDMIIKNYISYDLIKSLNYAGKVFDGIGDRAWHIGKCSKDNIWNSTHYSGIYTSWCLGGFGYIISRYSINLIKNDTTYNNAIYEDLYIALLLKNNNITPININTKNLFISPTHK